MKLYRIIDGECTCISVVEDPAIEEDFVKLSKDKQLLVGPALIPDKKISRGDYYISFDKDSIKKLAADYLKHLNVGIDHEHSIKATVLESWIKESENDKSVDYGFNLPVGTWFVIIHIDDDEVWQDIKNNKYGFSIEAMLFNKVNEVLMNKDDLDKTIEGLTVERDNALKELETIKSENSELLSKMNDLKAERDELLKAKESLEQQLNEALSVIDDLKKENEELKAEKDKIVEDDTTIIEELKEKLSKKPTATPIKRNPYSDAIKFILNK